MRQHFTIVLTLWVLCSGLGHAQTADEFEKGMGSVQSLMKRKKWKPALDSLQALLTTHSQQPHVYDSAQEVIEDLKSCLFYSTYPEPAFQDLIDGKIIKYNESTGAIKIEYGESMRDFERADELHYFPASFSGPYSVTLKGKSYPQFRNASSSPYMVVASTSEFAVSVMLGQPLEASSSASTYWMPGRLSVWKEGSWTVMDEKETPPCRIGKPFKIEVKVGQRDIRVAYGGRVYLTTSKPKDLFGGFGVQRFDFDELTIEGKIETSWLAGLVDTAMQRNYEEFEKSNILAQGIPKWLLEKPVGSEARGHRGNLWPTGLSSIQKNYFSLLDDLIYEERYDEVAERMLPTAKVKLPPAAHLYVTAALKQSRGDFSGALVDLAESRKLDPEYYWGAWRLADIHFDAGDTKAAQEAVTALLKAFPGRADGYPSLCYSLMRVGLVVEARVVVTAGLAVAAKDEVLTAVESMLVKAEKGPRWRETFEYKSRHYHVMTDIDKKTCEEAAELLEQAYLAYSVYLRGEKAESTDRFRVYLFSGESGYMSYAADVLGTAPTESAGLFSPYLKQLLIWNLPDRSDMMRTVQHEGFHQYVDQVLPAIPVWLNEGLAEYFEVAGSGTWTKGVINSSHVQILKSRGFLPLKAFLYGSATDFYSNAGMSYPQAWCFVHFLRHSTRENAELYKNLIAALIATRSDDLAMEQVFGNVDFVALEKALKEHLATLK